jgi:ABC-type Zn uptake system ZnuABC Zn-binding protein ZnuA
MKKYPMVFITLLLLSANQLWASPIKIATSLPDLASIAASIGGDRVEAFSLAKSKVNPHSVEVLPSYMIKVAKADIYVKSGLALDQWADQIIDGSRNGHLLVIDASTGVSVLQKPTGQVDASMGDVHPQGNPHYWLEPLNGVVIARNILAALKKVDPVNSAGYDQNFGAFQKETERRLTVWKGKMAKLSGKKIIGYHSSWVYLAAAFNLTIAGNVEPLPGIPPTAKHLAELIALIKSEHIQILIQEVYFPDESSKFLARETGIKLYKFSPSCQEVQAESYWKHFDEIIDQITQ